MKILHTADWHLGLELHGVSLLDAQRQMVRALAEAAQREGAEALLISGDVFDRVQAPPEAIALYDEAMALFLNELRIPVYLIAGNHDAAPRLGSLRAVLQRLHLHVAGRLDPFAQPAAAGGLRPVSPAPFRPGRGPLLLSRRADRRQRRPWRWCWSS